VKGNNIEKIISPTLLLLLKQKQNLITIMVNLFVIITYVLTNNFVYGLKLKWWYTSTI